MKNMFLFIVLLISSKSFSANDCELLFNKAEIQIGSLDPYSLPQLQKEFYNDDYRRSSLLSAVDAVREGRMSFQLLKEFRSNFESLQTPVSILIFKGVIATKRSDKWTDPKILKSYAGEISGPVKIREEKDYYVIEGYVRESLNMKFLGDLATLTGMEPLIYRTSSTSPTNHLFKIPKLVIEKFKIESSNTGLSNGEVIASAMERGDISLDAASAILQFKDRPIELDIYYSKNVISELRKTATKINGPFDQVTSDSLKSHEINSLKVSESNDYIVHRVKISSADDLNRVTHILGRFLSPKIVSAN